VDPKQTAVILGRLCDATTNQSNVIHLEYGRPIGLHLHNCIVSRPTATQYILGPYIVRT